MKILMISGDPQILVRGTQARARMEEYAALFAELHIVVIGSGPRGDEQSGNLFLCGVSGRNAAARVWRVWRRCRALAKKEYFDVVTAQGADETGLTGFFAARASRIPFQLQIHTDVASPWYRSASWKERVRYWMARFLIPRADCIRVVSRRIAESLPQTRFGARPKPSLGQKVTILPIFTDISKYVDASVNPETEGRFKDYDFKMIAVGRFVDREKNFSMLIDMMRQFVKICPRSLLVLVGEGPDRNSYRLLVTKYRLERNVVLESWRSDLPAFYKSFDVFLLSSNYEGWGLAVIEAMASGLAVAMTDVGLAGEIVRDRENGRVVPVGDARALLSAITDLYRDPGERRRLADAGRRTIIEMCPKTKQEYMALYKKSFTSCMSA